MTIFNAPVVKAPGKRSPGMTKITSAEMASAPVPGSDEIHFPTDVVMIAVQLSGGGSEAFTLRKPGDAKLGRGADETWDAADGLVFQNYAFFGPLGSNGFAGAASGKGEVYGLVTADAVKFFGVRL